MSVLERPDKPSGKFLTGNEYVCKCGHFFISSDPKVTYVWYWQRHSATSCTLELPDLVCWCGLKRSEHIEGHKRG